VDCGQEPAQAKNSWDPISKKKKKKKNPSQQRTGGVVQGVGPEFKPQYHKKKKKSFNKTLIWRKIIWAKAL
jgi:hypothetical protein